MSITRLQQARQMYAMGQRVAKTLDGSRPGYRGDGEYQGGRGYGGSKSSKGGDKGTGGSRGNIGGGGGGQNTSYRSYSPPTKKTYTSKTIDSKPVTSDDYTRSKNDFVNTLNRNNQIAAERAGTRFTPYQGGARMQRSNSLSGLLKLAAGFAFPGAGFLLNQGGKFKDGIMGLNNRIQNSDFGRSKNLMDYLDMRKYGGYDEREMARRINMDKAKLIQADIDSGMYDGFEKPTQTFSLNNSGMKPSNLNNLDLSKLETGDLNNLASLIETSQKPQSDFEYLSPNFNDGLLMDYQDIGVASDSYNYPDRRQLVNSGTITPLEDDFPSEGIVGLDNVPTDEEIAILRGY